MGSIFSFGKGRKTHTVTSSQRTDDQMMDVVFIHGLGGDATETWTNPDSVFWPEKWLAADLPRIRVHWSGLPTDPVKGNRMLLADHAGALLALLPDKGIGERPVIFVGHSLGGLIAKEILRLSNAGKSPEIARRTVGAVFYATPHRGSAAADFFKDFPFVAPIVEQLTHDHSYLLALHEDFKDFCARRSLPVLTFSEQQPLNMTMIVEPRSASCDIATEILLGCNDDHVSISKPPAQTFSQYEKVRHFIADLAAAYEQGCCLTHTEGVLLRPDAEERLSRLEIENCITTGASIPTRHFYQTDWCMTNWCEFFRDRSAAERSTLEKVLATPDCTRALEALAPGPISYISIGAGDGLKDQIVIESIAGVLRRPIVYYPLDISLPLLRKASATMAKSRGLPVTVKFMYGEFRDLPLGIARSVPGVQIFGMLGNTLGNILNDGDTLQMIARLMRSDDLLLFDVRARTGFDAFMADESDHAKASRFSFGPLETLGHKMDIDKFTITSDSFEKYSKIGGGRTAVIHYCPSSGKRWKLDHINFYRKENLEKYIGKCGLKVVFRRSSGGSL